MGTGNPYKLLPLYICCIPLPSLLISLLIILITPPILENSIDGCLMRKAFRHYDVGQRGLCSLHHWYKIIKAFNLQDILSRDSADLLMKKYAPKVCVNTYTFISIYSLTPPPPPPPHPFFFFYILYRVKSHIDLWGVQEGSLVVPWATLSTITRYVTPYTKVTLFSTVYTAYTYVTKIQTFQVFFIFILF